MEKLESYEQYSQILAGFKSNKPRCATNKMMTREEITGLIEAGKLGYEEIGDTMWFFTNEGYFYTGVFYVPKDKSIEMRKQDMDVIAELTGNAERYNKKLDEELVKSGFEKINKRLEHVAVLGEVIDDVERQISVMRNFWERRGFTYRTATKSDYPEMRELWLEAIGKNRYSVISLTDAELDAMERNNRCILVCDPNGAIVSSSMYYKSNNVADLYMTATAKKYQGSGLGALTYYGEVFSSYREGCTKCTSWVREDNYASLNMTQHIEKLSGKFCWQFLFRA